MKNSLELAISLVFLTGAMAASGSLLRTDVAVAGDGGAVGSISAQFTATGNNLTATSGAVAVGKFGGITLARTNPTNISTVAVGYSIGSDQFTGFSDLPGFSKVGVLRFNSQNSAIGVLANSNAELNTPQGNTFTAAPTLNLLPGTSGVNIP